MSHDITIQTAIVALKTITLLLGGLITYLAHKAYRRTGARPMRVLTIGFAIVTVGTLLAGVVDQVITGDFHLGLLLESALVAVGFAVILYSLYVRDS